MWLGLSPSLDPTNTTPAWELEPLEVGSGWSGALDQLSTLPTETTGVGHGVWHLAGGGGHSPKAFYC